MGGDGSLRRGWESEKQRCTAANVLEKNSMSGENPRSQGKESELRAQYVLPESDKTLKRVEIFGKGTINTEGSGGTCGKWVREGKKLEGWSRGFSS